MTFLIIGNSQLLVREKLNELLSQWISEPLAVLDSYSPDIYQLGLEDSKISIAEVKNLQKEMRFRPQHLPKKLAVLWHAERLTLPAQNAILKDLEDHGADTIYLLISPKPHQLLPTIRSRCQVVYTKQGNTSATELTAEAKELLKSLQQTKIKPVDIMVLVKKLVDKKDPDSLNKILANISHKYQEDLQVALKSQDNNKVNELAQHLEYIQAAYSHLNRNGNKRLVLENLVWKLKL